jgi:hypothetical protein
MQHAILDRLTAVPGVVSVGFSAFNDGLPLDGDGRTIARWRYIDGRATWSLRDWPAMSRPTEAPRWIR